MAEPLVALQGTTPTVNGAANFIQGAGAASDLHSQQLQQANASIGLMGQVALGAMGGNINGQADPQKWAQGQALLKAHGIDMSQYGADFAPTLARASVSTLGQLQNTQNQAELQQRLAEFSNTLRMQNRPVQTQMGSIWSDPNTGQPIPGQSPMGAGFGAFMAPAAQPAPTAAPTTAPAGGASPDIAPQLRSGIDTAMANGGAVPAAPAAAPQGGLPAVTLGTDGRPDPEAQQQFLAALSPQIATLVKQVAQYEADPSKLASLRGNQRMIFDSLVKMYNPLYDAAQYPARAAYIKNITSGTYASTVNSANTTIDHLSQLLDNSSALHNTDLPLWNTVANTAKTQTGSPVVTNFNTNAKAAGDELAKFFKGTGATDVGSIEAWHSSLDANASPAQQRGAVDTAIGLLKSRMDVLRQQYEQNMGEPAAYSKFLHPDTIQTLIKLGYDPDTLERKSAPAGGQAAPNTTSTGVTWSVVH